MTHVKELQISNPGSKSPPQILKFSEAKIEISRPSFGYFFLNLGVNRRKTEKILQFWAKK